MYILFTRWDEAKDEEVYAEFGPFDKIVVTHDTVEGYNPEGSEEITTKIAEANIDLEDGEIWWLLHTDSDNVWGEYWIEDTPQNNLCGGVVH
mgnify:CR=1 FL=1